MVDEIEKKIEDLELRLRLGKIDSLILFLPSLLGLAYSLLQYSVIGTRLLTYYIPVLFFGIPLPIYIGYIRGAIRLDSIVERARGWIYLAAGILSYGVMIVNQVIVGLGVGWPTSIISFGLTGGLSFIIYPISGHIGKAILNCFGKEMINVDEKQFHNTGFAAFVFSWAFVVLVNFRIEEIYEGISANAYIITLWICMAISLELSARKRVIGYRQASLKEVIIILFRSNFPFFMIFSFLIPAVLIFGSIYSGSVFNYVFVNLLIIISVIVGNTFS